MSPGLRSLDPHRARQCVGGTALHVLQVLSRHAVHYLEVQGVAGLQHHLLALVRLQHRRYVLVPAVVALLRLLLEPLASVDLDAFHRILLASKIV